MMLKQISRSKKMLTTLMFISLITVGCGGESEKGQQSQAIPVKLETLSRSMLIDSTEYVGTLEALQRVDLAPKIQGRIINIFVTEGDAVEKGQIIGELEPTQQQESVNAATANIQSQIASRNQAEAELRQTSAERDSVKAEVARLTADVSSAIADLKSAEADLQRGESELELAQINYERSVFLVERGVVPKQDLDNKTRDLATSRANVEALKKSRDSFAADVQASKEALNSAKENLKAAVSRVDGARSRVDQAVANIREAQGNKGAIEQELIYNRMYAPISGVVGSFNEKKVGDFLNIGEPLTTVTNNDEFNLNINIPTEFLNRLKLGLPVEIINNDGSAGITGAVTYVSPLVDQSSQSVLTKVTFKNDGNLKDDQYVKVRLIWDTKPGVLIPTSAVSSLGGQKFVFVAKPGESEGGETSLIAKQVPIKVGTIQGQAYQVISGVKQGDQIAVTRILDLKNNTPISEEKNTITN
jgi:RND family efflux transporter MFP subunit